MVTTNAAEQAAGRASTFTAAPLIVVAPLLLGFLASLSIVGGSLVGWRPFWSEPAMNVAEAAGISNAGEVVRLIAAEGQDPNRAWHVRADISGKPDMMLTPIEAAIIIRREALLPVLLRHGAVVPASGPERTALICRAVVFAADRLTEMLVTMGDGSDPRGSCPPPSK